MKHTAFSVALLCLSIGIGANGSYGQDSTNGTLTGTGETLEDFFTAALDNSPMLKIAEERLNIGSARKRAATGRLLPQINASANISDNRQNALNTLSEYDGRRYALQLSQVLFNWQAFSARKQASLLEDQLEAEYYAELANLLTDVAEKYFNVLQAEDAVDSINSEIDAVTNQLNQIQSFYDRQLALITNLYDAQASLAAVQAEQVDLQSALELAREALISVTGISVGNIYRLDPEVDIPVIENSAQFWVQQALANNQTIRARQLALQAAGERISETRGAYMPRVNFIVSRQNSDIGFENVPINQTDTTYVGLDVQIPIYAGGSNRAGVREATSQQSIVENELRQIELDVSDRTRTAYLQVNSSQTRTIAAERLAESTALAAEASQQGFELGVVTSVDVLNSLRDRYRAERDLQRTRYDHVKYMLILKREAGTLTAQDLLDVGNWLVEKTEP